MSNSNTSRKVADAQTMCEGYRIEFSQVLTSVERFNDRLLPLLDRLGVKVTGSFNDFTHFTEADALAAFTAQRLSEAGSEFQRERARLTAGRAFEEFMAGYGPLPRIEPVPAKHVKTVSWNEKAHKFEADRKAFFGNDETEIIARTSDELRALELLEAAAAAISALHLDVMAGFAVTPGGLGLTHFIDVENGKASVKKTIFPEAWRALVKKVTV